jgi:hypothetical protein
MPLPQDTVKRGTWAAGDTGDHPSGTFLFQGSKGDLVPSGGAMGMRQTCVNVYGKKHEGAQVYCTERVVTMPDNTVTRTHTWKTAQQYESGHKQLWRNFDMEPNRDYNTGEGLRDEGGAHLGGGNELCERDGTLRKANIETKCT